MGQPTISPSSFIKELLELLSPSNIIYFLLLTGWLHSFPLNAFSYMYRRMFLSSLPHMFPCLSFNWELILHLQWNICKTYQPSKQILLGLISPWDVAALLSLTGWLLCCLEKLLLKLWWLVHVINVTIFSFFFLFHTSVGCFPLLWLASIICLESFHIFGILQSLDLWPKFSHK